MLFPSVVIIVPIKIVCRVHKLFCGLMLSKQGGNSSESESLFYLLFPSTLLQAEKTLAVFLPMAHFSEDMELLSS